MDHALSPGGGGNIGSREWLILEGFYGRTLGPTRYVARSIRELTWAYLYHSLSRSPMHITHTRARHE